VVGKSFRPDGLRRAVEIKSLGGSARIRAPVVIKRASYVSLGPPAIYNRAIISARRLLSVSLAPTMPVMKKQTLYICLILAIAVLFFTATSGEEAFAQAAENSKVKALSLGIVFKGPREPIEAHFQDFVDYVARRLSATPGIKGRVVVAPTALQLVKPILEKQVDFYMESPYPTYLINKQGVATLLLRRWKGGMSDYRSLLFTSKESGTTRVEDLRGKIIAFEDPGSTSGYFLPKLFLLRKTKFDLLPGGEEMFRQKLVELFRAREKK
jgi:ABC-type phosphate/phosphonate transport system substrate-binding protein